MKKLLILQLLLFFSLMGVSQIVPNTQRVSAKLTLNNNIYLEFLGSGFSYSLNYERMYKVSRSILITSRAGLGFFEDTYVIPLHTSAIIGWYVTKIEFGAGINIMAPNNAKSSRVEDSQVKIFPQATIGVRFQPQEKGIMFRVLFTPFIDQKKEDGSYAFLENSSFPIVPWGGMSIGYSF